MTDKTYLIFDIDGFPTCIITSNDPGLVLSVYGNNILDITNNPNLEEIKLNTKKYKVELNTGNLLQIDA